MWQKDSGKSLLSAVKWVPACNHNRTFLNEVVRRSSPLLGLYANYKATADRLSLAQTLETGENS